MKNLFLPILLFSLVLGACNNTAPKADETPKAANIAASAVTIANPMEVFTTDFKKAVQANDPKMLSDLCEFPFESGIKQSEFIQDFDIYFDALVRNEIEKLTFTTWTDADGSKKQAVLNLPVEDGESQVIFVADKKGDKYKLIDILVAG